MAVRERTPSSCIASCTTSATCSSSSVMTVRFQVPRANQAIDTSATTMFVTGKDHQMPCSCMAPCLDST